MEGEHQSTSCGHGEVLRPGLCWAVEARERVGYDPKELTMGTGSVGEEHMKHTGERQSTKPQVI